MYPGRQFSTVQFRLRNSCCRLELSVSACVFYSTNGSCFHSRSKVLDVVDSFQIHPILHVCLVIIANFSKSLTNQLSAFFVSSHILGIGMCLKVASNTFLSPSERLELKRTAFSYNCADFS